MPSRSAFRRIAAVLHLPGVIERVPGDAARRVALRPALLHECRPIGGSLNRLGDRARECRELPPAVPVWWLEGQPELSHVGTLGVTHVIGHLVPVAAAAARTLAEFSRCSRKDPVIDGPCGLDE